MKFALVMLIILLTVSACGGPNSVSPSVGEVRMDVNYHEKICRDNGYPDLIWTPLGDTRYFWCHKVVNATDVVIAFEDLPQEGR